MSRPFLRFLVRLSVAALTVALAVPLAAATPAPAPVKLKVGYTKGVTSADALYVAVDRGFFKAEGIDVELIPFASGAAMPPALATGELDAAFGAMAPGFYNLLGRGLKVWVVASGGPVKRPADGMQLTVRTDLVGQIKGFKDLKGHVVSGGTRGATCDMFIRTGLQKAGVSATDVRLVYITASDQAAGYANKAIDAACSSDPFATGLIKQGLATRILSASDVVPGLDYFALSFADQLAQKPDIAARFMTAYVRGQRSIATEGLRSPENMQIIVKYTGLTPEVLRASTPPSSAPNCYISAPSVVNQLDFWQHEGLLDNRPDPGKFIDNQFCDRALHQLGRWK